MVSGCKVLCRTIGRRTQNRRSHTVLSPKTKNNNREHGDDNQTKHRPEDLQRKKNVPSELQDLIWNHHHCYNTKLLKKATTKPKACHQHPKSNRLYGANRKRTTTNFWTIIPCISFDFLHWQAVVRTAGVPDDNETRILHPLFTHISSNRGAGEYNFVFLVHEVSLMEWNSKAKRLQNS